MKKLFILLTLLIVTLNVNAQCPPPSCVEITTLSGSVQNTSYNGSQCFLSYTPTTITNSVNWNNFQQLSFNGEFTVNQAINLNNQSLLYSTGDNIFSYVTMTGNNRIYVDGLTRINNLISNNSFPGTENTIYTNTFVNVQGTIYIPGDTIITAGGTGNNVVVKSCSTSYLSIKNEIFYADNNKIYYDIEVDGIYRIYIEASENAQNWHQISELREYKGQYNISENNYTFYRLKYESEGTVSYSKILKVQPKSSKKVIKRVNVLGQDTDEKGLYWEIYQDGTSKGIYK